MKIATLIGSIATLLVATMSADDVCAAKKKKNRRVVQTEAGAVTVKPKAGYDAADALSAALAKVVLEDDQNASSKSIQDRLQGSWICLWDQRDGKPIDRNIGKDRVVFKGDEFYSPLDGRRWKYRLHTDTKPMGMDYRRVDQSHTTQGIFWLGGNILIVCDRGSPTKRPESFADGKLFQVYQRYKAGPAEPEKDRAAPVREPGVAQFQETDE